MVLRRSYAPVQGNARARKQEWVGWEAGQEEGIKEGCCFGYIGKTIREGIDFDI